MPGKGQGMTAANMSRGRGTPWYGKLMTDTLPSEVKTIWYSRDEELPELPQHKWSWELETDLEQVERRELLTKIMADAPLTDRQWLVVELVVIEELTLREVGQRLDFTQERARQIYLQAMRKLRRHQFQVTGTQAYKLDCEVTTWRQWKWGKA
jgi:RNA polymerase sigma factor (sigma-70 family)